MFCASTVAVSNDSVSPSSVDHWSAVGKFGPRRSVDGESGRSQALHWVPGTEWITEGPGAPFAGLIG